MNKKKLISFGTTLFLAAALVLGVQMQKKRRHILISWNSQNGQMTECV